MRHNEETTREGAGEKPFGKEEMNNKCVRLESNLKGRSDEWIPRLGYSHDPSKDLDSMFLGHGHQTSLFFDNIFILDRQNVASASSSLLKTGHHQNRFLLVIQTWCLNRNVEEITEIHIILKKSLVSHQVCGRAYLR